MIFKAETFFFSLLLLLLPTQASLHFWPSWSFVSGTPVDYLSPTLFLTDILIAGLVVLSRFKVRLPLLVIIYGVLNILFSLSPPVSLIKWLRVLEYFWLFNYLTSRLAQQRYHPARLTKCLSLAVLWSSLLAWGQFYYQASLGGLWSWLGERPLSLTQIGVAKIQLLDFGLFLRSYATFPHPNALAGFLLVSALLIKRHAPLAALVALATLPLTFSRTSIILELAVISFWILTKFHLKWQHFALQASVLFVVCWSLVSSLSASSSWIERVTLAREAITTTMANPFIGTGLGTFPTYSTLKQPVHNVYLLVSSEHGLPALLASIYLLLKRLNQMQVNWTQATPFLLVMAGGLVDHYWLTSHQNLLLLSILFATLAIQSKNVPESITSISPASSIC